MIGKENNRYFFLDIYLILNENDANIIISRNMCQYGVFFGFFLNMEEELCPIIKKTKQKKTTK